MSSQSFIGFKLRGFLDGVRVARIANESRKSIFLEVEEARRALDVGKRFRHLRRQDFEQFATHEDKLKAAKEFLVVDLANPKEVHDIDVQIVQNFHFRRVLVEENLCPSGKGLDVSRVCRKERGELIGDSVFAADV
jgi:hypothetical protein